MSDYTGMDPEAADALEELARMVGHLVKEEIAQEARGAAGTWREWRLYE